MTMTILPITLTPRLICAIITDGLREGIAYSAWKFGVSPMEFNRVVEQETNQKLFSDNPSDCDLSGWLKALEHYHRLDLNRR